MLQKSKLEIKAFIVAQAGTVAVFENGLPAVKVQFWALSADGTPTGVGVYDGSLAGLDLLPDFAGFHC